MIDFMLPEKFGLVDFRLIYGMYVREMIIKDQVFEPERVRAMFPHPSGIFLNIEEPARYSLVNRNPEAIEPYLQPGENRISLTIFAEENWEERPFDMYA